jgi:hypothetical protein
VTVEAAKVANPSQLATEGNDVFVDVHLKVVKCRPTLQTRDIDMQFYYSCPAVQRMAACNE